MAKKLRKRRVTRTRLLLFLLIPWAVMGLAALLGLYLELGEVEITAFALASSLVATVVVRLWMQKHVRAKAGSSEP